MSAVAGARGADQPQPHPDGGDRIQLDTGAAAAIVFDMLYAAGARRFAVLSPDDRTYTVKGRVDGFRDLAFGRNLPCAVLPCDGQSYAAGRSAMTRHAAALGQCDGLFAANDLLACGALDGLRLDLGRSVPGDMALVGFDDIEQASWAAYDLSTVRQDARTQATMAVELMRNRLQNPDAPALLKHPPLDPVPRSTT